MVQISAFVDAFLASFLGQGAVVALNYAQSLYTLPVSLFGMSVSAAELPAMSQNSRSVRPRSPRLCAIDWTRDCKESASSSFLQPWRFLRSAT